MKGKIGALGVWGVTPGSEKSKAHSVQLETEPPIMGEEALCVVSKKEKGSTGGGYARPLGRKDPARATCSEEWQSSTLKSGN